MKKALIFAVVLATSACGFTSKGNETIGQVKKVLDKTPILCADYTEADVSLGVMVNGVGSMSHEDMKFYVEKTSDISVLKDAANSGALVKIAYDDARFPAGFCVPTEHITSVELVK